jgi:16S rRNA C967 or C1407 C5-methylase (RsmB/RsmF family)
VQPTRADSTKLARTGGAPTRVPGLADEPGRYDRVLCDPPCSALGLRPRLLLSSAGDGAAHGASVEQTAAYQRLFLYCAVRLLKEGGVLVYSTCTLTAEENEGQVARALATFPCLQLVPAEPRVGAHGRPGLGLSDEQCAMVQRFEPVAADSEGFFIAKFIKRRSEVRGTCGEQTPSTPDGDADGTCRSVGSSPTARV